MSLDAATVMQTLRAHQALTQALLELVEEESRALRRPAPEAAQATAQAFASDQRRRNLLPQLDELRGQLRHHRTWWQSLTPEARDSFPEIDALIRLNQDLIMRVVFLDRENESARMRAGRQIATPQRPAPVAAPRPHFVSHLYQRHTS
jgi:hypothetical protein